PLRAAPATTHPSPPSLHDALPISPGHGLPLERRFARSASRTGGGARAAARAASGVRPRARHHALAAQRGARPAFGGASFAGGHGDRKSTRLNSSHVKISYAVFCLK